MGSKTNRISANDTGSQISVESSRLISLQLRVQLEDTDLLILHLEVVGFRRRLSEGPVFCFLNGRDFLFEIDKARSRFLFAL